MESNEKQGKFYKCRGFGYDSSCYILEDANGEMNYMTESRVHTLLLKNSNNMANIEFDADGKCYYLSNNSHLGKAAYLNTKFMSEAASGRRYKAIKLKEVTNLESIVAKSKVMRRHCAETDYENKPNLGFIEQDNIGYILYNKGTYPYLPLDCRFLFSQIDTGLLDLSGIYSSGVRVVHRMFNNVNIGYINFGSFTGSNVYDAIEMFSGSCVVGYLDLRKLALINAAPTYGMLDSTHTWVLKVGSLKNARQRAPRNTAITSTNTFLDKAHSCILDLSELELNKSDNLIDISHDTSGILINEKNYNKLGFKSGGSKDIEYGRVYLLDKKAQNKLSRLDFIKIVAILKISSMQTYKLGNGIANSVYIGTAKYLQEIQKAFPDNWETEIDANEVSIIKELLAVNIMD